MGFMQKEINNKYKKRIIYFEILLNIVKSEGGEITCQTITVEAAINY